MHGKYWWELTPEDRQEFLDWVEDRHTQRNAMGAAKYGRNFEGDPLDQAIEEALDLLFYLWMAKRRHNVVLEDWSEREGGIREQR